MEDLLSKSKKELVKLVEDLNKQLKDAGTADASDKIKELETTISEQAELINDLLDKNQKATASPMDGKPTVTVEGKEYSIAIKKFIHAGREYTGEAILTNAKLAKELVAKKSPVLKLK